MEYGIRKDQDVAKLGPRHRVPRRFIGAGLLAVVSAFLSECSDGSTAPPFGCDPAGIRFSRRSLSAELSDAELAVVRSSLRSFARHESMEPPNRKSGEFLITCRDGGTVLIVTHFTGEESHYFIDGFRYTCPPLDALSLSLRNESDLADAQSNAGGARSHVWKRSPD